MTVLDAYAVLGYLRGEPCADQVADLMRSPSTLTAVNAAEVVDQLVRVFSRPTDDVHADLALLAHVGLHLLPVSADIGMLAGQLRARHYHRVRSSVSLADCVAAAAALTSHEPLATSDPALAIMVRAEGGEVQSLPDSGGALPF